MFSTGGTATFRTSLLAAMENCPEAATSKTSLRACEFLAARSLTTRVAASIVLSRDAWPGVEAVPLRLADADTALCIGVHNGRESRVLLGFRAPSDRTGDSGP